MKNEKIYRISRIILTIMSFIIFNIVLINEDKSWLVVPVIFAVITYMLCFLTTKISKKIISISEKISNHLLKLLYYIALSVIILIICIGLLWILDYIPANSLGQGLISLFIVVILCIGVILPYIQSLVVILLKKL